MSWTVSVPAEDPADDRPLLERFVVALTKAQVPEPYVDQLTAWVGDAIEACPAHLDQGVASHGHLNTDHTGSYTLTVAQTAPARADNAKLEGDAIGLQDLDAED